LGNALAPLLHENSSHAAIIAQEATSAFASQYQTFWLSGMRKKLGLLAPDSHDQELIDELLQIAQAQQADFTQLFFTLTKAAAANSLGPSSQELQNALALPPEFSDWKMRWAHRMCESESFSEAARVMRESNPVIIPRNHHVERVLLRATEQSEMGPFLALLAALQDPFNPAYEHAPYFQAPSRDEDAAHKTFCGT
jgi:uncharacterized protein YdiU (UPF0061 family)